MRIPPALRHRRFLIYWIGIVFAWAGTQMQLWSLLWHIRTLTDQPIALGTVGLIRVLPTILLSLLAGAAADTFNRRSVMFVTQSVMVLVSLSFGLLTVGGGLALWQIYALVGVQALAVTFDLPARQSLVPHLVPARELPNALSLQTMGFQVGGLAGPALSGVLIDRWGLQTAYLVSASCVAVMVLSLAALGAVGPGKETAARGRPWGMGLEAIRDGLRFTFRHPLILSSMFLDFLATLFTRADTLMPIIARDILGVGPVAYGWLSSAQAIGAALAGLLLSQAGEIRYQGRLLLVSVVMIGVGAVGFGLSRWFPLTMAALIVIGASDAVSSIIRNTLRQLQTPDRMRGRMVGVNQMFFMGGPQLGELKSGLLGQWLGVPLAVAAGGVACLLSVGWVARRWPQLAAYNGDEPVLIVGD